ncbi:MAG TPA: diaminopimelate epimerase [Clostridiales bacterium]|jgi:diaminopimelate epimerase|nr:diaminopimelate epimerase [Clostridiales bacterium]HQP70335.1 diaminopimelate epimerase [Clostridiales bacterium]
MKFYKLHGAGNDFIFLAGNKKITPESIAKICDRNLGIGADGVINIKRSGRQYDFIMKYYNSDGSEADFCANGGRCAVKLAEKLMYFAGNTCRFKAGDGEHYAEILPDGDIKLEMKKPDSYAQGMKFSGVEGEFYFLNTGVEHTVGYFEDISKIDVDRTGKKIRFDGVFSKGTNVNFVQCKKDNTLLIRTYERGVEGETKACGTGTTAAGYLDMMVTGDSSERKVITVLGFELKVSFEKGKLFLTGPAELVFSGTIF